jgi:hypothetical protein
VISVAAYGAVGNGSTDDTTAITNAIAAVPTQGKLVFSPGKNYLISSTLVRTTPIHIDCQGAAITFASSVAATVDMIQFSPTTGSGVGPLGASPGWSVQNCYGNLNGHGRTFVYVDTANPSSEISDLIISNNYDTASGNAGGSSVLLYSCSGCASVYHVTIEENNFAAGVVINQGGDSIRILNNRLTGNGYGVYATPESGAAGLKIAGNNITAACPILIEQAAGVLIIRDNEIEQIAAAGYPSNDCPNGALVDLQATTGAINKASITGNSIACDASCGASYGIYVANVAGGLAIGENFIAFASGGTCIYTSTYIQINANNYFSCGTVIANVGGTVVTATTHNGYP